MSDQDKWPQSPHSSLMPRAAPAAAAAVLGLLVLGGGRALGLVFDGSVVSASCPNHFEGLFRYKSIPVEDNQMVEISACFQEAIGFIGKGAPLPRGPEGLQRRGLGAPVSWAVHMPSDTTPLSPLQTG